MEIKISKRSLGVYTWSLGLSFGFITVIFMKTSTLRIHPRWVPRDLLLTDHLSSNPIIIQTTGTEKAQQREAPGAAASRFCLAGKGGRHSPGHTQVDFPISKYNQSILKKSALHISFPVTTSLRGKSCYVSSTAALYAWCALCQTRWQRMWRVAGRKELLE